MKKTILATLLLLLAAYGASAQFYLAGDDPASLKWQYIRTKNYKIIFPAGRDSLAKVYARALETNRDRVALSAGYMPGQKYWCTTPVVLHTNTSISNGSVAWAPMRMDLYTLPDAYRPEPTPWVTELAIHESRHVAQLQFGADGALKPFTWLFGESATGAAAGMFPSTWMLEGDAVVAETALSKTGRGRSSDFLAYYMTAFDKGDFRNWEKWRWGSWRRYAPNHYALGYLTIAGARYLYNDPLFTSDYLHLAARRPLKASKVRSWFKDHSGKTMDESFMDIMQAFNDIWQKDARARAPFDKADALWPAPSWYTTYSSLEKTPDGNLLAIKSSLISPAELISIAPDGTQTSLKAFAEGTSKLSLAEDGRIFWSESVPHLRWSLAGESRIRVLEEGKIKDFANGHRYYNPSVGKVLIAVTEYPFEGGSNIVLLDKEGQQFVSLPAPDGYQFVESVWLDNDLVVSYINNDGFGLAILQGDGSMIKLLPEAPVSIHSLKAVGDRIYMISDRGGVSEVYSIDKNGLLKQETNTEYGVTAYAPADDGLWVVLRRHEGNLIHKISGRSGRNVSSSEHYHYAIADTLSAQEKRLADAKGVNLEKEWDGEISAPKNYNKLLNAIRIHSWVPLSIDYDAVSDLSSDDTFENLKLGATVLFQNTLGTLSGIASYAYDFNRKGYNGKNRHHSFHLDLTYTGLYPVIEAKVEIGKRDALQYKRSVYDFGEAGGMQSLAGSYLDQPLVSTDFKVYIPFNLSSGGWQKGFIPQVRMVSSNDRYNKGAAVFDYERVSGDFYNPAHFLRYEEDSNVLMHRLYLSARGYIMRYRAASGVYPSLGIGAEAGYHFRMALTGLYSPGVYAYLYGYLPGLGPAQGLRLTALWQHQFSALRGENAVKIRPRGMAKDQVNTFLSTYTPDQLKVTADYAIPFWIGDISCLSPVTYIKNFVFTPHADYTFLSLGKGYSGSGGLLSAGADLTAKLANILWFPYDSEIGLSFNYNGGKSYALMKNAGVPIDRVNVSLIFKTSL